MIHAWINRETSTGAPDPYAHKQSAQRLGQHRQQRNASKRPNVVRASVPILVEYTRRIGIVPPERCGVRALE